MTNLITSEEIKQDHISWSRFPFYETIQNKDEENYIIEYESNPVDLNWETIHELENLYDFEDRYKNQIIDFLIEHYAIIPLVRKAYFKIQEYFPKTKVILKLYRDREYIDDPQLVIKIDPKLNFKEAIEKLRQLDKDWWLNRSDRTNEILCIDI